VPGLLRGALPSALALPAKTMLSAGRPPTAGFFVSAARQAGLHPSEILYPPRSMMAALRAPGDVWEGTMGMAYGFGGRVAILAMMIALLGGCGTVISAAGTAVSTTFDIATDAVGTTVDLATSPFDGDEDSDDPVE